MHPGAPCIREFKVLFDRRHILTLDSEKNVAIYDVLSVSHILLSSLNAKLFAGGLSILAPLELLRGRRCQDEPWAG